VNQSESKLLKSSLNTLIEDGGNRSGIQARKPNSAKTPLPFQTAEGHDRPYSVRVDKGSTLIPILGIRINYADRPFGLSIVKGFPFVPPYTNDRHGILILPICSVHCPGNDR
jgi:hypothetical protein